MDPYVRQAIPDTTLSHSDGTPVALTALTRSAAVLLVFASTPAAWLEVEGDLVGWGGRLAGVVRVAAVVPDLAVGAGEAVLGHVLLDPGGRARAALAPDPGPTAVVLGTDGLLAGGPVHGIDEISAFVRAIEEHLGVAPDAPRVLVTSAALGRYRPNSVTLPQYRGDQRLRVDVVCTTAEDHPSRERAMHPRLAGKIPKMLAWDTHPGYDHYLWLDSCFSLTRPDAVAWFLDHLGDHEAAFFRHRSRTSIREELDFVLTEMEAGNEYLLDRYRGEDMDRQVATYLGDPTFHDDRLIEAGAFVYSARLVSDARSNAMREWFHHNCRWSVQDQLSLPYVLHQFDVDVTMLPSPSIYDCAYLR